jgi:hypothetical protein
MYRLRDYVEDGQNQNQSSFCILLGLFLIPLLRSRNPSTIEVLCHLEVYCLHWWREKSERWWIVNVFSFYAIYFPDVYIRWTDSCSQPVPAQCTCMLLELAAIYMALWGIKYILERRRNTNAGQHHSELQVCVVMGLFFYVTTYNISPAGVYSIVCVEPLRTIAILEKLANPLPEHAQVLILTLNSI